MHLVFRRVAYRGLETGNRQFTSYVLRQGKANFVFTTPSERRTARPASTFASTATAFATSRLQVDDADLAFEAGAGARRRAGRGSRTTLRDEHGTVRRAAIQHLRRHHPLADLATRTTTGRFCRASRVAAFRARCGHSAHRSHGRQRRAGHR